METQKKRIEGTTVYIDKKIMDAVRSVVYFKKSKGERITITSFFEEAIKEKLREEGVEI
jgi:hypothetical protein